jgi:excisionase family DNA binding protein
MRYREAFPLEKEILMNVSPSATNGVFEPRIGRSISLDHAAEVFGVSRRTIYNWIRIGRVQTVRTLGGSQRVLTDAIFDDVPRRHQ